MSAKKDLDFCRTLKEFSIPTFCGHTYEILAISSCGRTVETIVFPHERHLYSLFFRKRLSSVFVFPNIAVDQYFFFRFLVALRSHNATNSHHSPLLNHPQAQIILTYLQAQFRPESFL